MAAIPAASPVARQFGITLVLDKTILSTDIQRPATSKLEMFSGIRHLKGIP